MDQMKIGRFVAELRREHRMTQEALGQKLGVTNKTISRWENGNYMPDIEMLVLLSSLFGVSIHELLSGERLSEERFRQEADQQLLKLWKASAFSSKERSAFWKRKWLREHVAALVLAVAVPLPVFIAAVCASLPWLMGVCPAVWLAAYAFLRNRMMSYVESKVFPLPDGSTRA